MKKVLEHYYEKHLSKYEKLVIQSSENLEGVYWTKNKHFHGAKAFYSDPIDDHYWTLIEQFRYSDSKNLKRLVKEVEEYFGNLNKNHAFYLTEYDRKRKIHEKLKDLGYDKAFVDSFMFYDGSKITNGTEKGDIRIKEVRTYEDNEIYIDCYTRAYMSNPEDVYFDFGAEGVYEGIYRRTLKDKKLMKNIRKFIGYYHGIPACCGALYFKNGIGYVLEVGTDNKYRRRGLAKAVSTKCVNAGVEEGCDIMLLGTEEGSPAEILYKSIGFVPKVVFWGMSKREE